MVETTISVIKADIGSLAGHVVVPDFLFKLAREELKKGVEQKIINDFYVANAGDDLELIMTHNKGEGNSEVHELAWNTFMKGTELAREKKIYAAGQDILADTFSGNVKGMGPGSAEMTFEERRSEPIAVFMADKTEPGAFNLPLYKIYADPFNTAGLVIDPNLHDGFRFVIQDIMKEVPSYVEMKTPEESYDVLALLGSTGKYTIKKVYRHDGMVTASVSTDKLSSIAGKYVGKDDPVAIIRAHSGLPAMGEILEAFTLPHLVSGWMRGSHAGPLLPVGLKDSRCTRFDGPPRVVGLGFQVSNGMLVGPVDFFEDVAFDISRQRGMEIADYLRRHGPFQPHRLSDDQMEYTTLPKVLVRYAKRFVEGEVVPKGKAKDTSDSAE
ncbi:MAG: fructose-1,6-bisphosphate aldolase/phosphatase [Candidatus Thorarchaeota archaeon]|nr:MAG: fructose 1,6-bisphosphatase [Candidatus Thorarchaeota archaeon]RLI55481.1 MAG: fructose 1,6-bisphosphatase [Candidatus Thorarchaeota archaeon]